jgi:hypothetical protein
MKRKKRKKCFFSSSLFSFLPFRLDTNAEKKKIPMMHPTTTINKRRKKRKRRKRKKTQKSFLLALAAFLHREEEREKKTRLTTHIHKPSPFSIAIQSNT